MYGEYILFLQFSLTLLRGEFLNVTDVNYSRRIDGQATTHEQVFLDALLCYISIYYILIFARVHDGVSQGFPSLFVVSFPVNLFQWREPFSIVKY